MISRLNKQNFLLNYGIILLISTQLFYIAGSLLANLSTILIIASYIVLNLKQISFESIRKYKLILILVFICILLNVLNTDLKLIVLSKIIQYLRFIFFAFGVVFFLKTISTKINIYINLLIFLTLFLVLDSFIQFSFGKDIFGFEYNNLYFRISGPFGDEWIIGSYLLNIGFLSIAFLNYFFKINNKINLILFFLVSIAILFSGERAAFLGLIYFLFFAFIFSNKKKFIFLFSILLLIVTIISINTSQNLKYKYNVILNLPLIYSSEKSNLSNNIEIIEEEKINNNDEKIKIANENKISESYLKEKKSMLKIWIEPYFKGKNSILQYWIGHYYRSIQIFSDNILTGSGFRTHRFVCKNYQDKTVNKCSTHPHNFHLEILSDNGLLGYFLFIYFIFYISYIFFKKKFYNNFGITLLFSIIISFIFPFKPTGSFFTTNTAFIFYILVSHFFYLKNLQEKK